MGKYSIKFRSVTGLYMLIHYDMLKNSLIIVKK